MSAISTSTTTVPRYNTRSSTTIPGEVTQPITSRTTGSLAPINNVSASQTPSMNSGSQGMTTAPNISQSAARPATSLAPTSSTQGPSTPKTRANSKKISHLSHIAAATWIGVGLAFGALVVAVYYGAPVWRLARWTALNDFRASCISDHDRGLQESVRCKTLLADPAKPPPVVKRTVHEADERVGTTALRWAVGIAIPIATLVVFFVRLKGYTRERRPVQDSIANSDVWMIYEHSTRMQRGHVYMAIPTRKPTPGQEHDERENAEEEDDSINETGASTKDSHWDLDYDDDLTLARDRYYFGPTPESLLTNGETGSNEALHHFLSNSLDQEPDNASASDSSSHHQPTVKDTRDPRQPTWVQSTSVEPQPALFNGSVSLLKFDDGTSTKDLRMMARDNRHLRAIKVPVDHGASTCRLMASRMFTEKERKHLRRRFPHPDETTLLYDEDPIVWKGKIDARARMARLLGLRGQRGVYLILDPKFVEDICSRFDWITEFEWESDKDYTLVRAGRKRSDEVMAGIKAMGRVDGEADL